MGVLTDIVLAHESEAGRVGQSDYPLGDWPGIDSKGIGPVELDTLWAIAAGCPDTMAYINRTSDELLYEGSADGPWVYRLPDELVGLLSKLDSKAVAEVAAKWAQTDELRRPDEPWASKVGAAKRLGERLRGIPVLAAWAARRLETAEQELAAHRLETMLGEHLAQISALARRARQEEKHLLMWVCL